MARTTRSGFVEFNANDHHTLARDLRDGRPSNRFTQSRKALGKHDTLTPWYKAHTARVHRRINKQRLHQEAA